MPDASSPGPSPLPGALRDLLRCGRRTVGLLARRRIHQLGGHVGQKFRFADGTAATVYRETVIDRPPPVRPAVLAVCFRLRRVRSDRLHALFRVESELNTVLFAGFPGLVSKLWFGHDEAGRYRGLYQWDDPDLALSYVRSLWWALAVVSEPGSISYRVVAGAWRDQLLAGADPPGEEDPAEDDWWRPEPTTPLGG